MSFYWASVSYIKNIKTLQILLLLFLINHSNEIQYLIFVCRYI